MTLTLQAPCIYDSTGVLLTLVHWRQPGRAYWAPLLDTKLLPRLASGRKNETYFPIAVADNKFHCIILKGGDRYPYFPRPLLSDFDFSVPLHSPADARRKARARERLAAAAADGDALMADPDASDSDADAGEPSEARRLEQAFLLQRLQAAQLADEAAAAGGFAARSQLTRVATEIDKTLLQLLAVECREGEDHGMKALELVGLLGDRTGRMVQAAERIAERYERTVLGEKIREMAERAAMEEEE